MTLRLILHTVWSEAEVDNEEVGISSLSTFNALISPTYSYIFYMEKQPRQDITTDKQATNPNSPVLVNAGATCGIISLRQTNTTKPHMEKKLLW